MAIALKTPVDPGDAPPMLSPVFMDDPSVQGGQQQQLARLPFMNSGPDVVQPSPTQQLINSDQARLEKVRMAQARPYGFEGAGPSAEFPEGLAPNHPGKLGHVLHALSVAGNIAGNIVNPNAMALIPQTQLGMKAEEAGLTNRIGKEAEEESQNQERGAKTAEAQEETKEAPKKLASELGLQGAKEGHLNAETEQIGAPAAPEIHDTPMGLMSIDKANATATPVTANGTPIGPKLETSVVSGIISHTDGKPHSFLVDKQGNKVADLGEHYERPVNVNVGRAETPGEQRSAKNDLLKAYQPTLDSAERMNVMTESYEKAVKDHDQQAMLNLLANHLGMTMGLQKGARLTKDIIREAQQSQPWLQGLAAKFDKDGYLAGVTLSPNQMRQMVDLGQSRYAEDAKKSRATAQYLGAKDDGPDRVPGKATIRFYLGKANGDAEKAKQLATEDGWTVK